MNKIRNIVSIAGVVITLMGTLCTTVSACVDSAEKIRNIKEVKWNMAIRKTRSDCRVGTFEKTRGLPAGSVRNPNGRDARSDKKIGTLRKEFEKSK